MIFSHLGAVMTGGALGAALRYFVVSLVLSSPIIKLIPYASIATLVVNILGSFVIGFLAFVLLARDASEGMRLFFIMGLLGSFTTVSAFSLETLGFILKADYLKGVLNVVVTVFLCVLATWCGLLVAKYYIKLVY